MNLTFKHILILAMLLNAVIAQNPDRKNMAIYNFSGLGVSPIEAQVISDRIRVELGKLDTYSIIERGLMEQILKEQVLQLSGLCEESSCLVEVGRILAVHYMVGGSVSKLGNLFTIEARIIDVESGEIVTNVVEDYNGPIENLLVQTTRIVAAKLCGIDEEQPTLLLTGTCDLLVTSNPTGGTIYINDKPVGDVTPFRLEGLVEGDYKIKVRRGNLVGESTISLARAERKDLTIKLEVEKFIMRINSDPEGADVNINQVSIGKTPLDYTVTDTSIEYLVQVKKDSYFNREETVRFSNNSMLRMSYYLVRCGTIQIHYQGDVEIYINDEHFDRATNVSHIGTTPYNQHWVIDQLEFANYNIRIEKEYHQPYEASVALTPTRPNKLINAFGFKIKSTDIVITSNVDATSILTDRVLSKKLIDFDAKESLAVHLPFGNYSILAKAPGYLPIKQDIALFHMDPDTLVLNFHRPAKKLALKRSLMFPGMGQIYSRQPEKGIIFSVITGAGVGWLIKSLSSYNEELSRYNNLEDSYRRAERVEERDSFHKQVNASRDLLQGYQNQFLAAGALVSIAYTWNIVDILRLNWDE